MKVLVSGGSGMLGTALRRALAKRVDSVLQLVRGKARDEGQIAWSPTADGAGVEAERLEGCGAAIHLSGANVSAHRWSAAYRKEIAASRVDSTRALATLLAGLREPPRAMLVASAVGIYGDRGDAVLDEASAVGEGFLADVCRQWEAAAQPAVDAGIRVVHLRFGVALGKGPGALEKMLPVFRMGLGGKLGSGQQWMSWVSVEDVVGATLFALDRPELAGAVNVTAPEPVTNAEFTRALGRQLHRPAVFAVPAFALRLALGPMADEALLSSTRAVPKKLAEAGFQFQHSKVEAALAAALG